MPFDTQILSDKIAGIKTAFQNGRFADALVTAVNTGIGLMQQRIFTHNIDVEGQSFGQYIGRKETLSSRQQLRLLFGTESKTDKKRVRTNANSLLTPYQRKRANKGRQILKKDLEFSGGLRRSIVPIVENETSAEIGFNNIEAATIAKGQENQITNIRNGGKGNTSGNGVKIFRLNKTEKEQVVEQGLDLIKQILKPKT